MATGMRKAWPAAVAGAAALAAWKLGPKRVARGAAALATALTAHVVGTVRDEVARNRELWRRDAAPQAPPASPSAPPVAPPHGWRTWWTVLRGTFAGWNDDHVPRMAG